MNTQLIMNSQRADDFESTLPPKINFFSVAMLAKILNVSKQHIYRLVDTGAFKISADLRVAKSLRPLLRIPRESIVAFLNKRRFG